MQMAFRQSQSPRIWEWEEGVVLGRGEVDFVERIPSFTSAAQFQAPSSGVCEKALQWVRKIRKYPTLQCVKSGNTRFPANTD